MPILAIAPCIETHNPALGRVTNGVAQDVFQRLRQGIEVAAHPARCLDRALQLQTRPAAFIAGVVGEHFPQRLNLDRFIRQRRAVGVEPGQLQGVLDQPLHAVDFAADAFAQLRQALFAFAGHAQAAQRRAQFVRQVAQQLLLQGDCALQALGHGIEGPRQLTEFIRALGDAARQAHIQLVGAPGVGLFAQVVQRHHQQAIQADTEQQGEQPGNHAVGDHPPEHPVLARNKALGQLDDQNAGGRILRERYPQPRSALLVDRPVEAAQKGQVLHLCRVQRLAAQRLQISADHADPTGLAQFHALQPVIDAIAPAALPRLFGLRGITAEGAAGVTGEELIALLHVAAPRPAQPDHQQTERHQQARQFPEQRMPPRQLRQFHRRRSRRSPCPTPCALRARCNRWL